MPAALKLFISFHFLFESLLKKSYEMGINVFLLNIHNMICEVGYNFIDLDRGYAGFSEVLY